MTTKVFSLNDCPFTFGSAPITGGYGENDFIKVEKIEEDFVLLVGCDGEGTRVPTNNNYCKITLTLSQTSIANIALSAQRTLDLSIPGGAGIVPWQLKDIFGSTLANGPRAWISKPPAIEIGKGVKERVWEITAELDVNAIFGGN